MGGPPGRPPDWGAVSLLGARWAVAACPPGSGGLEGLQHPDPSTFIDWVLLAEVTARSAPAALASAGLRAPAHGREVVDPLGDSVVCRPSATRDRNYGG